MTRKALAVAVALTLISFGYVMGKAQTSGPDFELIVDAPPGQTNIRCVRACKLMWVERGNSGVPQDHFTYGCEGGGVQRCSSGKVGGWVDR